MYRKSKFKILIWKSRIISLRICLPPIFQKCTVLWKKGWMTEEAMLLGTRQISQVKIVSEIGLIWIIILTEKNCDLKKNKNYFHIFTIFFT